MENNQNIFELAKKLYESNPPEEVKTSLEKAFPELKEKSEEEKVIRDIKVVLESTATKFFKEKGKMPIWYDRAIAWLEKQGEQKPADKLEISEFKGNFDFKVGQWIIATGKCTYCIIGIDGFNVTLVDIDNNKYVFDVGSLNDARLWTIQDAKDGDILVSGKDKHPFIFRGLLDKFHPNNPVAYCGIDYDNKFFIAAGTGSIGWWTDEEVKPATKEQRNLLFQRIEEEGYVWDAELKKIEPKLVWTEEDEERINNLCYFLEECGEQYYGALTLGTIIGWLNSLKERVQPQPKQEWNEEDESMRIRTIGALSSYLLSEVPEEVTEEINWLKSLKEKVQPQPKQEWSEEDKNRFINLISLVKCSKENNATKAGFIEFINKLKALRPQNHWRPSEEQIQVLQWCLPLWNELKTKAVLESLIADLEKLK